MIRAYSYIRFSSVKQSKGGSLERQLKRSKDYCERRNINLDDTLNLRDLGVSAFKGKNAKVGALAAFLKACEDGKVPRGSYLILESLDRMSRDKIRPTLQLFFQLQEHGITIVTIDPEREYPPECNDPLALIEPILIFARAHEESCTKSSRVKDSWDKRKEVARSDGTPMSANCKEWLDLPPLPAGVKRINARDARFLIKSRAKETIEQIFQWAIEGKGGKQIAKILSNNRDKYPPFAISGKWTASYVGFILKDQAVVGIHQPGDGPPIPDYYPQLIAPEVFEKAQACRKSRKFGRDGGKKTSTQLFTGLLFDADTGRKFIHRTVPPYQYLCPTDETGEPSGTRIRYDHLETAILCWLDGLVNEDLAIDQTAAKQRKQEMTQLEEAITDITNRIKQLEERADTVEDFDSFLTMIEKLGRQRKQKADHLEQLRHDQPEPVDLQQTKKLAAKVQELLAAKDQAGIDEVRGQLKRRIKLLVGRITIKTTFIPDQSGFRESLTYEGRGLDFRTIARQVPWKHKGSKIHHVRIKLTHNAGSHELSFIMHHDGNQLHFHGQPVQSLSA